eukprot:GHVS01013338.1.p1 GENE.GHVS01013338.1~~GHVS01013338.1.p1  ORF type:complete len:304 (+),score=54.51 GHVS01013338.1:218-1129(+)
MVLFKDFVKQSSDLLNKDFPYEKPWDVEVKHKGGNATFTNCASISAGPALDASSTIKYNAQGVNTEIRVTPNGGALCDVSCSLSKYVAGLSLGSRLERKSSKTVPSDSVDLSCEYEAARVHTRTQFNPIASTFVSSACITCNAPDNVRVGGEISGGRDMSALKYSIGSSYTKKIASDKLWTVALRSSGDLDRGVDKVLCNVHSCSGGSSSSTPSVVGPTEMAMEVKHSIRDAKTGLTFGALWYVDDDKKTSVKAKIAHDASLGVAVSHAFTPAVTGVLGMQVDTMKMSSVESVKYGVKIYCKA